MIPPADQGAVSEVEIRVRERKVATWADDVEVYTPQRIREIWHGLTAETCLVIALLERWESAEASLAALRGEQEQLQKELLAERRLRMEDGTRVIDLVAKLVAAEATGEAAVSRIAELNERIERDAEEFEALANRSREVTEGLRQQLADRSAAIAQIVQEMRESAEDCRVLSDADNINAQVAAGQMFKWADRLDAVGAERTTQRIEEQNTEKT